MAKLTIHTLGRFQVLIDGISIQGFASDKVRLLLAYLAIERGYPQRREHLAAMFWPNASEQEGRANLRWVLSDLRKVLGDRSTRIPFLLVTRQSLELNPSAPIWIDVTTFDAILSQPNPGIQQLEDAIQLYQGEFLAGINPKDSLPLDEWILVKRENLACKFIDILQKTAQQYLQRGEYVKAIPLARQQVELEPWQEQGHRQLMRLLAYTHQRNAALNQYQSCQEFLMQTLGVSPEKETTALYEQIRQGDMTAKAVTPHNLPTPLTHLIGRENELRQIQSWLKRPEHHLITLLGPGGIGKTHLAIQSALEQCGDFRHGAYFVPLDALNNSIAIVPAIAEAIGLSFAQHKDLQIQLLDYLRDKEILLLLDNFEHLLEAADLLAEILRTAPAVKILVTSRVSLNIPGEQRYPLSGLELPEDEQAVLQSSAVKLFTDTALRLNPRFDPSEDELDAIVEICRFVDGLPLGILLAVAWINVLSPVEIAAQIQHSLELLETDWEQLHQQHRSIRVVLQSSWDLLDQKEQTQLAALSVFRGSFTRQTAKEISGASSATLQRLVEQSLLHWSTSGRFHPHELLRQFAAEQLGHIPSEKAAAQSRHGIFFLQKLAEWGAQLNGPQQSNALAQLQIEQDNLIAAWNWGIRQKTGAQLVPALDGLCRYLEWRVRFEEGYAICQVSLGELSNLSPNSIETERLRLRLLLWQSRFCWRLSKKVEAYQLLESALMLIYRLGQNEQDTFYEHGFAYQIQGNLVNSSDRIQAMNYYHLSLGYFRQAGTDWEATSILSALGSMAWNLGDYGTAVDYHSLALQAYHKHEDVRGIARASMALGTTMLYQGRFSEAEPLVLEGSRLRRKVGDQLGIADALRFLGFTRMVMGNFDSAVDLLYESVQIYESLGLRYGLEMAMLAAAHAHQGEAERAWFWSQQSLEAANETGYRRALGYALLTHGELALIRGDYLLAEEALQKSLSIYQQINQREELCRVLVARLFLTLQHQNQRTAVDLLQSVEEQIWDCHAFIPLLYLVPAKAWLLAQNGNSQRAEQMLAAASRFSLVEKSHWFGQLLANSPIDKASPTVEAVPEQAAREALWEFIGVEH
jgi:DNA-binding SARP family transcriptional activator/predicted ATPase